MRYSALTRRYFETAASAGTLDGAGVRRGTAGSRAQGAWRRFDLRVGPGTGLIEEARFLAYGCPHTIAVAAWVAERAVGGPARAELPEDVQRLRQRFEVPVEKLGRLLVVEDAWRAAFAAPPT